MISVSIKKRFRNICGVRESEEKFITPKKPIDVLKKNPFYWKMFLASTCSGLITMRQVSVYLSDLEMNWTSSFLVQRDKLAIVVHLLLASVGTVVKPVDHEVTRRPSPIQGRCRDAFR